MFDEELGFIRMMISTHTIPLLTISQERKLKHKLWLEKLKQLEEKEKWLKDHPLVPEYKPRLSDPSPFWLVFFRQKQAFECTTAHHQDVHTFAFEPESLKSSPGKGLRKYVVTSHAQLWHTVKSLAYRGRHGSFYEVIPEGATCKMYFDLEFRRDLNPDADGGAMVQTLIKIVCFELKKFYNIHCSESHVINLDASTGSKFSRHLIFNIPGAIFKDNIHAGNFVRHLCNKIESYCRPPEESSFKSCDTKEPGDDNSAAHNENGTMCSDIHEPPAKRSRSNMSEENRSNHGNGTTRKDDGNANDRKEEGEFQEKDKFMDMFINVPSGGKELFIDLAVYTRNRNFRLYKCVKLGRSNPLLVATDNHYKAKMTPKKKAGGEEYQFFLDSLITHVMFTPYTKVLTCEGEDISTKSGCAAKYQGQDGCSSALKSEDRAETIEGYKSSPFPDIDTYIRGHCISRGGVAGDVRRWTYFSEAQLLVYDIVKNRWCENIGRPHKSNNIMILVDLRREVYYQKCHDPACRAQNYKSDERPIPPEYLPSFTDWDEEELINVSIQAEEDARISEMNQSSASGNIESFLDDCEDDEELMRLSERYDAADDNSAQRKQNGSCGTTGGSTEQEERMRLAENFDNNDRTLSQVHERDGVTEGGSRINRTNEDEWDNQITDEELLKSFQS